jgi:demethylmenaquinone methyltransferase / 2-methoxy-6-polyprenyl-1,4-benzoquinol methylase
MNDLPSKTDSWRLFDRIARGYDRLNQVLSLGMVMRWRRSLVACFPNKADLDVLDVATGTADIPLILARSPLSTRKIVGLDLSEGMLAVARGKLGRSGFVDKIELKSGDGQALPFEDNSYDVVTVGFGLRNFPDLMKGIAEAYRVLRPGGVYLILEFSRPTVFPFYHLHAAYLRFIVPFIGLLLTGDLKAYSYLSRTAVAFPYGERFVRIIRQAGFRNVERKTCFLGAATIYISSK